MPNNFTYEYNFKEFFYDVKSISSLFVNWCLTEGEVDDEALFLATTLQNIVKEFEKTLE